MSEPKQNFSLYVYFIYVFDSYTRSMSQGLVTE